MLFSQRHVISTKLTRLQIHIQHVWIWILRTRYSRNIRTRMTQKIPVYVVNMSDLSPCPCVFLLKLLFWFFNRSQANTRASHASSEKLEACSIIALSSKFKHFVLFTTCWSKFCFFSSDHSFRFVYSNWFWSLLSLCVFLFSFYFFIIFFNSSTTTSSSLKPSWPQK